MTYRSAQDENDYAVFLDLTARSFAFPAADLAKWLERLGRENVRVVERDGQPVGTLAIFSMAHYFGGRAVPTFGIAAVGIEPEARGRGVGRELMQGMLEECAAKGVALSTLYPATVAFYRKLGYELAGARTEIRLPVSAIGVHPRPLRVRRLSANELGLVRAPYRAAAMRSNGWLERHDYLWGRVRDWRGEVREGYVTEREGEVRGYLFFAQRRKDNGHHDVCLSDFVALDADAGHSLWAFLGDHRSLADELSWFASPADPLLMLLPELGWRTQPTSPWMLRIVDVHAALEARGYPAGVRGELAFAVDDDGLPANRGPWTMTIEGGRATVRRAGTAQMQIDVRGLATMFSGHMSAASLAAAGRLQADAATLAFASALFAGEAPNMPDMF